MSDAVFARRAYLDIWGLLPSPGELQAFVTDATSDKRARLVEQLLADGDKYAQHWISFWNDLLRNDEGANYYSETASRKSITEWLLGALEHNLPYDQFVRKLLHPIGPQDPEGFLVGVNWRGVVSASQTPAMQAAQNTAQIFLGVNLKCNACHDSFISKWKLADAYGLASFFSAEALDVYRCDKLTGAKATLKFLYPELGNIPADLPLADRQAIAAELFILNAGYNALIDGKYFRPPLPIMADESYLSAKDLAQCAECYHAVNVKLVKTGGISEAYEALKAARGAGLKTMIGCMIESSVLISAGAHLAELADYLDLDGNLLVTNDPFRGPTARTGILSFKVAPEKFGLRVIRDRLHVLGALGGRTNVLGVGIGLRHLGRGDNRPASL